MFAQSGGDQDATRRMFALHDQMVAKYEGELHEARAEVTALRHENTALLRKFEHVDIDTARAQQASTQYTSEIQALMTQTKDMREMVQKVHNELHDVTSQRDNMQYMLEDAKAKGLEYENRLLRTESATTCQVELETRIARQNAVISELQRDATVMQESNRTLQAELASCRRNNSEHAKEKEDLALRVAEGANRAEGDQDELARLRGEVNRLREQIQSMARQQVETLNKHLQCVEGKHRKHVADLKDENIQRVNDLTTVQARLAKSEWSVAVLERERSMQPSSLALTNAPGATNPNQATVEIIESQQRTIHDLTSKNNELTIAMEKIEMSTRRELRQSRLDLEEARTKLEEASSRAAAYRREADDAKASLDRQGEELSRVYTEVHTIKIQLEDNEKKKETEVHSLQRQMTLAAEKHRGLLEDQTERTKNVERKLHRSTETFTDREAKLRQETAHATDRLEAEACELRKSRDEIASVVKDLQGRHSQLSSQYMDKEREAAQMQFNVQKLMQGLDAHKAQIVQLNEKNIHGEAREHELRSQHHELLLRADAMRSQAEGAAKERDVALVDLAALCGMLKSTKTSRRTHK